MDWGAIAKNPEYVIERRQMTLESATAQLKDRYESEIRAMVDVATVMSVDDDDGEKNAITMAGQLKDLIKKIEDQRKTIIKDSDEFVRGVNGMVKYFRDDLEKCVKSLKAKVGQYQYRKELDRRKREEAARKAAEELQKKVNEEAKQANVVAPVVAPLPVERKQTVTRTESGASAHIRTEWKMTAILDFSQVPDEYKIINEAKVRAAIKAGIREIPGLKIEEGPITVLR